MTLGAEACEAMFAAIGELAILHYAKPKVEACEANLTSVVGACHAMLCGTQI